MAQLIKTKSDPVAVFRNFLRKIRLFGYKVHIIRIDNYFAFLGADFQVVCQEFDIVIQTSVPYMHHQLGRMEREWRTLSDIAVTMLDDSTLDKQFWGSAFLTAKKKERKKSLTRGHVKDIGSTVGMQSYNIGTSPRHRF